MDILNREKAESERDVAKVSVVLYEAYRRLVKNPDFKLVVENYYLKGYLLETLDISGVDKKHNKALIAGMKVFKQFMADMELKGESAIKDLDLLNKALNGELK